MELEHYNHLQLNDTNVDKWDDNLEYILNRQRNRCSTFKILHEMEYTRLSRLHRVISIVSISIVSLIATGSSITNDPPINQFDWTFPLNVAYSILLYFSAVISSIQNYYSFDKNADKNREVSLKYSSLSYNIKRMLYLKRESRFDAKKYFEWVNKELDKIMIKAPVISEETNKKFEKKYPDYIKEEFVVLGPIDNDEHYNPDILENIVIENQTINYDLDQFMNDNDMNNITHVGFNTYKL